jgi:hypothetical protein
MWSPNAAPIAIGLEIYFLNHRSPPVEHSSFAYNSKAGKERTRKRAIYESTGILYYLIYAPLAQPPKRFQIYKLVAGEYILQTAAGLPAYWMPELGLGIGAERRLVDGIEREWLFWYDEAGLRYPTPSDRADLETQRAALEAQRARLEAQRADQAEQEKAVADQRAAQAEQQAAFLRQKLRDLGIDPDLAE